MKHNDKKVVEWAPIREELERQLDSSLQDYEDCDFWTYWINNVDGDVISHSGTSEHISDTQLCIVDVLQNTREAMEKLVGDDDLDDSDIIILRIFESIVDIMGDDAHDDIYFMYTN